MDKAANGKNHCAIRYDHQNFLTPLVNGFKFWSPEAIWRALKDVPAFKPWIPQQKIAGACDYSVFVVNCLTAGNFDNALLVLRKKEIELQEEELVEFQKDNGKNRQVFIDDNLVDIAEQRARGEKAHGKYGLASCETQLAREIYRANRDEGKAKFDEALEEGKGIEDLIEIFIDMFPCKVSIKAEAKLTGCTYNPRTTKLIMNWDILVHFKRHAITDRQSIEYAA